MIKNQMNKLFSRSAAIIGFTMTISAMSCTKTIKVIEVSTPQQLAQKSESLIIDSSELTTAEELAQSAEQLVSPYTFMFAYKLAAEAVKKDPENKKAQFHYLFLKRFEAFRGILPRIRPGLPIEEQKKLDLSIKNELPDSPLKEFLTQSGGKAITKPSDIQDVLDSYYKSVNEFRLFLKNNEQTELNIYLNPYVFQENLKNELVDSCQLVEKPDNQFVFDCKRSNIATKKLNIVDMIGLRQMAAAEILYGIYFTSYNINGIEKLTQGLSAKQKQEILFANTEFGKLRKNQLLTQLKGLGADFVSAAEWAMKYNDDICRKRKNYLFEDGICVYGQGTNEEITSFQQVIDTLNMALGGVIEVDVTSSADTQSANKVRLNYFAWSDTPVQDLRQIAPVRWNKCDQPIEFNDNTLGGIFVDNNAHQILNNKDCQ